MYFRRSAILTSSLLALSTFASSPASAQKLIQIPKTETSTLVSGAVGDSFVIRVMVPPTISGETTRFPVVYMTDVHEDGEVRRDVEAVVEEGRRESKRVEEVRRASIIAYQGDRRLALQRSTLFDPLRPSSTLFDSLRLLPRIQEVIVDRP